MKKYTSILLLSTLSMIAGCTMEEAFTKDEQNNTSNGKEITIQAVREDDSETRTVLESDGSVWWTPGDAISLFYGSGTNGGSKFTSNATEISKVTNFTGVITAITGGGEIPVDATYFWGVYPYSEDVSCDGNSVTLTVPSKQTAVPGTFATDLFPSIGRSQGLIMGFYNVCGGWRFSITKEGVRKVTLKSNNGELITGKVKVGFDDSGIPEVREIIDGSDEVVLECPAGEYFEVGKNYYMIMLPKVFESGFTMTFETYTEKGVYNRAKETTITRSKFSGITNIDSYLTTSYTIKDGGIPIEEDSFKELLVQEYDTDGDGEISYEEAETITSIEISTEGIESIAGIEYMTNLEKLVCLGSSVSTRASSGGRGINYLDPSNNRNLNYIDCRYNQLTTLDLSNNYLLEELYCEGNLLTSLDVSGNPGLHILDCSPMDDENGNNLLSFLLIDNGQSLQNITNDRNPVFIPDSTRIIFAGKEPIYVPDNYFKQYLVSNFDYDGNGEISYEEAQAITEIEYRAPAADNYESLQGLEYMINLKYLCLIPASYSLDDVHGQLRDLNVTMNTELTDLICIGHQLTSIDLSRNTKLKFLNLGYNEISTLDISNNPEVELLGLQSNHLTNIDFHNNLNLKYITLTDNLLENLDVSNLEGLIDLCCDVNNLSELDVSNNKELSKFYCSSNNLTAIDVSNNPKLVNFQCWGNRISSLNLSRNHELDYIECYDNPLTELDLTANPNVLYLKCSPMDDEDGDNLLSTLYLREGHTIEHVTTERDSWYIPDGTEIRYVSGLDPVIDDQYIVSVVDSLYFSLADEKLLGRDLYWEQACANDIVWGRPLDFNSLATFNYYTGDEQPLVRVFNQIMYSMGRCNWLIRYLRVKESSSNLNEIEYRSLGEAYMLRAYLHFLLAYRYGTPDRGVPFVDYENVEEGYDYTLPDQLPSVSDNYQLITVDLEHARAFLPMFEEYDGMNKHRAHKASTVALMAKVYAYWATWDSNKWYEVIHWVDLLEHDYNRRLADIYSDVFSPYDYGYWSNEYCWGLPSDAGATRLSIEFPGVCLENHGWGMYNGQGFFKPTQDIYEEMAKDNLDGYENSRLFISIMEYRDEFQFFGNPRLFYSSQDYESGFMIHKYLEAFFPSDAISQGLVCDNPDWPCTRINWPIVRFGDCLLLRAEANLALGNRWSAAQDINRIRERSHLALLNGDATWADLYHERRCELAFEMANDHAYDCKRWAYSGAPEIRELALLELNNYPLVRHHLDRNDPESSYEVGEYEDYVYSNKNWSDRCMTFPYPSSWIAKSNGRWSNPPTWY